MNKSGQNCRVKWTTHSTAVNIKWKTTVSSDSDNKLNQDKNEKSTI